MKLSELVYMCKPQSSPTDALHWSEEFIRNFWLWKVACDCCHQWRLFVSGALLGLIPFIIELMFANAWWIVFPYVAVCLVMCITGYFNVKEAKANETNPEGRV